MDFKGQRNSLLYERLALLADKEEILEISEKGKLKIEDKILFKLLIR